MKNRKAKTDTIYLVARVLELPNCPSLPFRVIMSMQDVGGRDFAEYKVHHYFATSNAVFVDNCIVCKSTTSVTRIFLWRHDANTKFRGVNVKEKEKSIYIVLLLTLKWNVVLITAYKVVFFYMYILFPSICNQSIPIYLSFGIDNRYRSITTRIFAIDWSSIININQLIDIDCRFYRLDTPGYNTIDYTRTNYLFSRG